MNQKQKNNWHSFKEKNNIKDDKNKENFLKYGTIYGKKYCVKTDYGDWDKNFTIEILDKYIKQEYYQKLKKVGLLLYFFDLWKITTLKELLEKTSSNK